VSTASEIHKASKQVQKNAFQWRFLCLFLLLLSPVIIWPLSSNWALGSWFSAVFWIPFLSVHCVVPILDLLFGDDNHLAIEGPSHPANRWLPMLCLPAWLLCLTSGIFVVSNFGLSWGGLLGLILSLGALGGTLAINPAHELIHRRSSFERNIGGVLLSFVFYGAFKVEHVRGHHLNAATHLDTASATLGQSLFHFVPRSILGTFKNAYRLESDRLARLHITKYSVAWFFKNEVIRWDALSLAIFGLCCLTGGWLAGAVFLAASLGAILELEIINYIEHYGLRRSTLEGTKRFEPVQEHHSWNTNRLASNTFLFNLQRHSDHHAHAGKDYLHLNSIQSAPQLPAGYSMMMLVALCPPLWRKLMDHRIPVANTRN
jgi:alkane 1-monooxygenase